MRDHFSHDDDLVTETLSSVRCRVCQSAEFRLALCSVVEQLASLPDELLDPCEPVLTVECVSCGDVVPWSLGGTGAPVEAIDFAERTW